MIPNFWKLPSSGFLALTCLFSPTPKSLTHRWGTEEPSLPRSSSSQPLCGDILTSRCSFQEPLWQTWGHYIPVIQKTGLVPHSWFQGCPPSTAHTATGEHIKPTASIQCVQYTREMLLPLWSINMVVVQSCSKIIGASRMLLSNTC